MEAVTQAVVVDHKVSRVGEVVLAILGGVFGLIAGLLPMSVGGISNALQAGHGNEVVGLGLGALAFSTLAIVMAFFVSSKSKLAGWLLIVAAVGGTICVSAFYILPAILPLIVGLMCLLRGRK